MVFSGGTHAYAFVSACSLSAICKGTTNRMKRKIFMGKIVGSVFEVGLWLAEMKKAAAFVPHCRVVLPVSGKISNFAEL